MDVLGLGKDEVMALDPEFEFFATDYAWKTYNLRRPDLAIARAFGKKEEEDGGFKISMTSEEMVDVEEQMKDAREWTDEEKESFEEQVIKRFGGVLS